MKKPSVSVGIPAYNEEANIGHLLREIIAQRQSNFRLKEIIIISDGSTDGTVGEVKKFKDNRINLVIGESRIGQAARQNEIIRRYKGDILVIVEADTLPVDSYFVENLIDPFKRKGRSNIGITYGTAIPLPPRNFFEKIMCFKDNLKERIYQEAIDENSLHDGCSGHSGRAFSRKFVQKLDWPNDVPEDTYSFLLCNQMGYEILNTPEARMHFRLVGNFKDYSRQYSKYIRGKNSLSRYFLLNRVITNYHIPILRVLKEAIKAAVRDPVMMFLYICVFSVVHLRNFKMESFHPFLEIYPSSKKLI